ncbi:MAG TPA: hypothetical protein VEF71_11890 [Streptosporangiaceae bacterium]|nr:hypothetical protein [Streptosporangiaceae bacterium]
MHPTIPQAPARSLHEVCELARRNQCGHCGALAGDECVFTTVPASAPVTGDTPVYPARGYHVGRLAAAETAGLITAADFSMALDALKGRPFGSYTVIFDVEDTAMEGNPIGPFETEDQARKSLVHLLAEATLPGKASIAGRNHRLLCQALAAAGVELGAWDHQIVTWLAGWEPSTVAVIAGWVARARLGEPGEARTVLAGQNLVTLTAQQAATAVHALEDADGYRRLRADQWCGNCETAPTGACDDHLNDLDLAGAYRDLAAELASILPEPQQEDPS